jgi:hypothetical protein
MWTCPYCGNEKPVGPEPEEWACCGEVGHAVYESRRCTCLPKMVRPTDIDPPEGWIVDRWCPIHGQDPDAEYERRRDQRLDEQNDYPQERE